MKDDDSLFLFELSYEEIKKQATESKQKSPFFAKYEVKQPLTKKRKIVIEGLWS